MTGEEIIVTFKEPWYNDYTRRLYTQLSEQMIREEIESSVNGEPFEYSDNTMYFTITPRLEQGEQTYTKTLANPLKYYLEKLALPNQDPYNTPVWIRFEGYMILRQVSKITLAVDSQSENWAEGVTFPSSGRWVKMNNSGRVFRFTGGEIDLNIELYTASAQ